MSEETKQAIAEALRDIREISAVLEPQRFPLCKNPGRKCPSRVGERCSLVDCKCHSGDNLVQIS